jgi:hypothetical protein
MDTAGNATRFRIISLVIVAVLVLQAAALVSRPGKWSWPFIDYPMYAHSHQEGERIPAKHSVVATTADGREVAITPEDVGVNIWVFERWVGALKRQAEQPEAAAALAGTLSAPVVVATWPVKAWLKSTWLFKFLKAKPDPDLAPLLLERLQARQGLEIVALRIEDAAVALSRAGPIPAPPIIVAIDLPLRSDK